MSQNSAVTAGGTVFTWKHKYVFHYLLITPRGYFLANKIEKF